MAGRSLDGEGGEGSSEAEKLNAECRMANVECPMSKECREWCLASLGGDCSAGSFTADAMAQRFARKMQLLIFAIYFASRDLELPLSSEGVNKETPGLH
jgi:hypothetical protein